MHVQNHVLLLLFFPNSLSSVCCSCWGPAQVVPHHEANPLPIESARSRLDLGSSKWGTRIGSGLVGFDSDSILVRFHAPSLRSVAAEQQWGGPRAQKLEGKNFDSESKPLVLESKLTVLILKNKKTELDGQFRFISEPVAGRFDSGSGSWDSILVRFSGSNQNRDRV